MAATLLATTVEPREPACPLEPSSLDGIHRVEARAFGASPSLLLPASTDRVWIAVVTTGRDSGTQPLSRVSESSLWTCLVLDDPTKALHGAEQRVLVQLGGTVPCTAWLVWTTDWLARPCRVTILPTYTVVSSLARPLSFAATSDGCAMPQRGVARCGEAVPLLNAPLDGGRIALVLGDDGTHDATGDPAALASGWSEPLLLPSLDPHDVVHPHDDGRDELDDSSPSQSQPRGPETTLVALRSGGDVRVAVEPPVSLTAPMVVSVTALHSIRNDTRGTLRVAVGEPRDEGAVRSPLAQGTTALLPAVAVPSLVVYRFAWHESVEQTPAVTWSDPVSLAAILTATVDASPEQPGGLVVAMPRAEGAKAVVELLAQAETTDGAVLVALVHRFVLTNRTAAALAVDCCGLHVQIAAGAPISLDVWPVGVANRSIRLGVPGTGQDAASVTGSDAQGWQWSAPASLAAVVSRQSVTVPRWGADTWPLAVCMHRWQGTLHIVVGEDEHPRFTVVNRTLRPLLVCASAAATSHIMTAWPQHAVHPVPDEPADRDPLEETRLQSCLLVAPGGWPAAPTPVWTAAEWAWEVTGDTLPPLKLELADAQPVWARISRTQRAPCVVELLDAPLAVDALNPVSIVPATVPAVMLTVSVKRLALVVLEETEYTGPVVERVRVTVERLSLSTAPSAGAGCPMTSGPRVAVSLGAVQVDTNYDVPDSEFPVILQSTESFGRGAAAMGVPWLQGSVTLCDYGARDVTIAVQPTSVRLEDAVALRLAATAQSLLHALLAVPAGAWPVHPAVQLQSDGHDAAWHLPSHLADVVLAPPVHLDRLVISVSSCTTAHVSL